MSSELLPPALSLPRLADIRPTSVIKALMTPERFWPRELLDEPWVTLEVRGRPLIFVADPDRARAILSASDGQLEKHAIYARIAGAGAGQNNLVVSSGDRFLRQKRILAPLFAARRVSGYTALFVAATERALARWRSAGAGARIDLFLDATRITFEAIWWLMFGEAELSRPIPGWVTEAADVIHRAQLDRDMPAISRTLRQTADTSLRHPPVRPFLDPNPFVAGAEGTGSAATLDGDELLDNVRVFLGAGHETSAATVTWCLWLLSQDPGFQQQVQEELDSVLHGEAASAAHVPQLQRLEAAMKESLRLYPSGVITVRQCSRDITLNGDRFREGSVLAVNFYALHRHRRLWDRADHYRPARFAPGSGEPRHPGAFLPFSAGPHGCLAPSLGWMESMIVAASILREFRVIGDAPDVRPQMLLGIRPDREVMVRVERRG